MLFRKSWFSAKDDCVSQGGHLVSITSDIENAVVDNLRRVSILFFQFDVDIWIGLNDNAVEGKFQWIDNTVISSANYTMWGEDEPDNQPIYWGDCVVMGSSGKWRDTPCWWPRPYVCESSARSAPSQVASTPPAHVASTAQVATTSTHVASTCTPPASTPVQVATTSTQPASTPASRTEGKEKTCVQACRHNFP